MQPTAAIYAQERHKEKENKRNVFLNPNPPSGLEVFEVRATLPN